MRPTRTIAAACMLAAMVSPCAVSQDQTQDQQNAEQGEWEVLREIPPYGPLEWDMSIEEALRAIPELSLYDTCRIEMKTDYSDENWNHLLRLDSVEDPDRLEVEVLREFNEAWSSNPGRAIEGYDGYVFDRVIRLRVDGLRFLAQRASITLEFQFAPGLIAVDPDRITRIRTRDGWLHLPHVLTNVHVSVDDVPASEAHWFRESVLHSVRQRFSSVREIRAEFEFDEAASTGAFLVEPHPYQENTIRFEARSSGHEHSVFRGTVGFERSRYSNIPDEAVMELTYRSAEFGNQLWSAYEKHIERLRRESPKPLGDVSNDL